MEILGMGFIKKDSTVFSIFESFRNIFTVSFLLFLFPSRSFFLLSLFLMEWNRFLNEELFLDPLIARQKQEIMRDVGRTFPAHPFFYPGKGPGEDILARILKAILLFRPDIGYCQV